MENEHKSHISSYYSHGIVLVTLLILTAITVEVADLELGPLSVFVALIIASIKGTTVLTYFMHLKYDKPIFRIMVAGVFILFAVIIGITFIDYVFR